MYRLIDKVVSANVVIAFDNVLPAFPGSISLIRPSGHVAFITYRVSIVASTLDVAAVARAVVVNEDGSQAVTMGIGDLGGSVAGSTAAVANGAGGLNWFRHFPNSFGNGLTLPLMIDFANLTIDTNPAAVGSLTVTSTAFLWGL